MTPSFIGNNRMNYMLTNAKYLCKFFAGFLFGLVKLSYLQNGRVIEYSHTMTATSGGVWKMSFFRNLIRAVVLVCANKEMVGVYAKAIIALVANKKSFWDFSDVKRIRKAMSKKLFSVVSASSPSGSITMRADAPFPVPAV